MGSVVLLIKYSHLQCSLCHAHSHAHALILMLMLILLYTAQPPVTVGGVTGPADVLTDVLQALRLPCAFVVVAGFACRECGNS